MKVLFSLLGALTISGVAAAKPLTTTPLPPDVVAKSFSIKNLSLVDISMLGGEVEIKGDPDTQNTQTVIVKIVKKNFSSACNLSMDQIVHTLKIRVNKSAHAGLIKCESRIEVTTPATVELAIQADTASIKVEGTRGPISYNIEGGDVTLDGEITKLIGKSGRGSVTVNAIGLTGPVRIDGAAVGVTATYRSVPDSGAFEMKVARGGGKLYMPASSSIAPPKFEAQIGVLTNEIPTSLGGAYGVSLETEAGDLVIKKI